MLEEIEETDSDEELYEKIRLRHNMEMTDRSEALNSSMDSFTANYFNKFEHQKKVNKENFDYLRIKTAEQVTKLITKCQDSLDIDFIHLH